MKLPLSTNLMCLACLTLQVNSFFADIEKSSSADKVSEPRREALLGFRMVAVFSVRSNEKQETTPLHYMNFGFRFTAYILNKVVSQDIS